MSLSSQIESLLFVARNQVSIKKLAELTESTDDQVLEALAQVRQACAQPDRGILLIEHGSHAQFATKGEHSGLVARYLKEELIGEMTKPQLETLTIIAYRGPITKGELEQIRGVNCSLILRNLMIRGLVEEMGDQGSGGAGSEYRNPLRRFQVTFDFLKFLGIASVQELPEYEALSQHEFFNAVANKDGEIIDQKNDETAYEQ